jgi:uncharacterized protein YjbI with pentapeptide repeats
VRKITEWLPSLHDPGPAHLWRIGYALAACFAVAVAGLVGLWLAARALLGNPHITTSKGISVHDTVGVAQLVFASVAGAGALVALVVAYRRQRVAEVSTVEDKDRWEATAAHDRTRVFNERFTAIATQLGDGQPAVRLAGVHAMAGLADDWMENRQTCVDVLCAYLRLPYDPEPAEDAAPPYWAAHIANKAAYLANREVRHTIVRLIGAHLRPGAAVPWQGLNLDFTGVVFDGGDFSGAVFSGGEVCFRLAVFSGGEVDFDSAVFSGGGVGFGGAVFSGGTVSFDTAEFSGGTVDFVSAKFSGSEVRFVSAKFSGSTVNVEDAVFSGGRVYFGGAKFSGGRVYFGGAEFSGGEVRFGGAKFSGSTVYFGGAKFSGGTVDFVSAEFSGGTVSFAGAMVSGSEVNFGGAVFSGGTVDFQNPSDWSHQPMFDWKDGIPPAGVTLPADETATPT